MAGRKRVNHLDLNSVVKVINSPDGSAAGDVVNKSQLDSNATADRSRANHTGTQVAATVSDFDTQVRTSRLDQMAAPAASVSFNTQKITGLAAGTAGSTDAARMVDIDNAITALQAGLTLKGSVRVAVTTNVNISAPGATLDGVTMTSGDKFLATAQTTGSQEGPYVWNGAATPATRDTTWDSAGEATLGSYWIVREGTNADKFAIVTTDAAITPGTTDLGFAFIGAAATNGYTENSPATSAGGTWAVTHGLGTRNVDVTVYRNSSPWDEVDVYVERPSTSVVNIIPDVAISLNEFTVIVGKVV